MPQITHLRELFSGTAMMSQESCTVLRQMNSRQANCGIIYSKSIPNLLQIDSGVDHPQGQGHMEKHTCSVQFILFSPLDLNITPYLIWISIGEHTHPPPPPTRTPLMYAQDITNVIRRIQSPELTTGIYFESILNLLLIYLAGLLKHPEMQRFCELHQGTTVIDVHQSFANLDKIAALLAKERILQYPHGTGIPAVQHEFDTKHVNQDNRVYLF